jgi:peptidyl-tRNA hydrolase, PTH1 family
MKLIVGLGNPGREYLMTRHNLGFLVIDQLAQRLGVELNKKKFQGFYCKNNEYILLKPQTYMNNSGECISAFMNYWQISQENLLVIYDDIALPSGKFRYREQGSDGGHNGMKNIIEKLGSNKFKRLRVGISYNSEFLIKDWVLGKFTSEEKKQLTAILPSLLASLIELIKEINFNKVMNKYNSEQK